MWWPPTDDEDRTDFAGAYWPVKVLKVLATGYKIRYDNGECENVKEEHVHPSDPPVEFGAEQIPLQVGLCAARAGAPLRWSRCAGRRSAPEPQPRRMASQHGCLRQDCACELSACCSASQCLGGRARCCAHVPLAIPSARTSSVVAGTSSVPLQVGEYVEVYNGSISDPCAWLGQVKKALSHETYMVRCCVRRRVKTSRAIAPAA